MIERVLEGLCQILRIAVGCLVGALIIPVTMQTSTMLQVNMLVIYIAVPVAGLFWAIFSSFRVWQAVQDFRHGTDTSTQ